MNGLCIVFMPNVLFFGIRQKGFSLSAECRFVMAIPAAII